MSSESARQSFNLPPWANRVAVIALGAVVLVGCNSQTPEQDSAPPEAVATDDLDIPPTGSPEVTPSPVEPTLSERLSPRDCSYRYVQIGKNLSADNAADLSEDLIQITALYQGSDDVGIRDMAGVGRIITDSYQDPLYVQAVTQARELIAAGQTLTVDELLAIPVEQPASCDANHIEKSASQDQLKETVSLSQSLTRQLGTRLGDRASAFTRETYEKFQSELDNLQRQAEEAERTPAD